MFEIYEAIRYYRAAADWRRAGRTEMARMYAELAREYAARGRAVLAREAVA